MWKFHDFSITKILREINFADFKRGISLEINEIYEIHDQWNISLIFGDMNISNISKNQWDIIIVRTWYLQKSMRQKCQIYLRSPKINEIFIDFWRHIMYFFHWFLNTYKKCSNKLSTKALLGRKCVLDDSTFRIQTVLEWVFLQVICLNSCF